MRTTALEYASILIWGRGRRRVVERRKERERTYIPILRWNIQFHEPMRNVLLTVIKAGFLHEVSSDSGIGSITSYNEVTGDIFGNVLMSEK